MRLVLCSLVILTLVSCGGADDGGGRSNFGIGIGNAAENSTVFSSGLACTAQATVGSIASGSSFTVNVQTYNASGTVTIPGVASTDSSGIVTFSTSYTNNSGVDVDYAPKVTIKDGSGVSATCSFSIIVHAPGSRTL